MWICEGGTNTQFVAQSLSFFFFFFSSKKPQLFNLLAIVRSKKKTEEILSISTCGTLSISRYVLLFILPSYLGFLSSLYQIYFFNI